MKYKIKSPLPQSRYIVIEASKHVEQAGPLDFQLSSWRPGRYELGNFAKNVRGLKATSGNGAELSVHKIAKDRWRIEEAPVGEVILSYEYYAAQPDAGACWTDEQLLYVNPVHCMIYDANRLDEECTVNLIVPLIGKLPAPCLNLVKTFFMQRMYMNCWIVRSLQRRHYIIAVIL
ncbi:MAG: hypothetical protein IPP46_10845 [Bacteroidetes bacterium]|nr:hypothetical protein [Bacteroidota bacterium]